MLRLFSSIRKSLLLRRSSSYEGQVAEHKTVRYMKYAVGEVLLIMVGIIMALQLNNWNEKRIEAGLEEGYLRRLIEVLERDNRVRQTQISFVETKKVALTSVYEWLVNPVFQEDRLRDIFEQIALATRYAYASSDFSFPIVFDELVSSGRVHIISNIDLRRQLLEHKRHILGTTNNLENRETDYAKRAYELVPRENEFEVMDSLSFEELKRIGERVLQSDFENVVIAERNRSDFRKRSSLRSIQLTETLLAALRQELEIEN